MIPKDLYEWPVKRFPNKTAVIFGEKKLTFREYDEEVSRLANGLLAAGVRPQSRVAVLLPNGIEITQAFMALQYDGVTAVALNSRHSAEEHAYVLADCGASAVITSAQFLPVIQAALAKAPGVSLVVALGGESKGIVRTWEEVIMGQPATPPPVVVRPEWMDRIQYTSGTTGRPKGAVATFEITYNRIMHVLVNLDQPVGPDDVNLSITPLTHAAIHYFTFTFVKGAANVILPGFEPETVLETIERHRVSSVFLVPTTIIRLLEAPKVKKYDLSSLKYIWYGASPMPPERLKQANEIFGPVFRQNYGMTESTQPVTYLTDQDHLTEGKPERERRLASAGRPALGIKLRIVDENDEPLPPGEIGQIVIQSNCTMHGYHNRPEQTAEALKSGWHHSGDMGYLDEAGYLFIVDRKNDMIISGGFNIYPREVEDVLNAMPGVAESAVIGVPDDVWGESVKALVVLEKNASLTESGIIEAVKRELASYKKPRSVEFVSQIPRDPNGKMLRRVLKEKYWQGKARLV